MCSCTRGLEPPEVTETFMASGQFMPDSASDVWAFGMLLVRLLRGQLPQQHLQLVTCPAFRYGNPAVDPRTQPGFKAVLEYLTGLLCSGTNYAAQVRHVSSVYTAVLTPLSSLKLAATLADS